MMRALLKSIAILALSVFASGNAFAQAANTSTVTVNSSMNVLQPLTLTKSTDLVFGRVVKPRTGMGTLVIANTSNTVTASAGAVALTGIATSRATLTISGEGAQAVSLTIPTTFNLVSGANTILVTLAPDLGATTTLSNSLGTTGTRALNIGASVNLPSTQASGAYTGTFSVIAAYQ